MKAEWQTQYIEDAGSIRRNDFKGKGHREGGERGWNVREFIAWDGEGITFEEPPVKLAYGMYHWEGDKKILRPEEPLETPQTYVLLANSKGDRITNKDGLRTVDCFEMLLECKRKYPLSIFVGFAFNYDVNQILKDLPEKQLWHLHDTNVVRFQGYRIQWRPRKTFYIKHMKTQRSVMLYDCFGFFQTSFLEVCKQFLGADDPRLVAVQRGKESREHFDWEQLDDFIIPYCDLELEMMVEIMNTLRQDFHGVGIDLSQWHGPGAAASKAFNHYRIPISRNTPTEVLDASQFAYAGGRFEPFFLGRHQDNVWEYDINSAYPAATTNLPDLSEGSWELVKGFEPGTFGVWHIDYRSAHGTGSENDRPQPLFCRSESGSVSYPREVQGWYWTPEAELVPNSVREGWVFRPATDHRPFAFVERMYDQRRLFKDQKNPAQRALKLILNSIYGKLAQTVGGQDGPPRWHQLEWAGYITSFTRAMIFKAISLNPSSIIAVETDAVFSREPLDLPVSPALGDWSEDIFDEITYLQSGFYYAVKDGEVTSKYRGMDKDKATGQPRGLPYEKVIQHLETMTGQSNGRPAPALRASTTRFVGLGFGLRTEAVWRSWEKKERAIRIEQTQVNKMKRAHYTKECPKCMKYINMAECLHPTVIGGYSGVSYARSIPWRSVGEAGMEAPIDWSEWCEMNGEIREFATDMDRWQ